MGNFTLSKIAEELKKTEGSKRITLCFQNGEVCLIRREDIPLSTERFWGEISFDVDSGLVNVTRRETIRP